MKNQLFNKRIPTILGIVLVVIGIVLTTIIIKSQTIFKGKASNSEEPQNVKVTNLSDSSFTISYQTDIPTTGSVNYGTGKELGNTELDDLDKDKGNFSPKNIHSITVKKLTPATKYDLAIISGQNTFLNNGGPFEISTGPNISATSSSQIVIKGKLVLPNGNPASEAFVYLSTDNSQLLSSVTKNGDFNFSLNSLRSNDLSSYLDINQNTIFKLLAISNSLKSTVVFTINEASSIPTITLSNDYDFTTKNDTFPVASKSAQPLGFPTISASPGNSKPQILAPKQDQSFTDQKPQFHGTSLPNQTVQITIHSQETIQDQVTADGNGNWTYRPSTTLSPGVHTITIQTRDSSGILTTLMQSFTVFAQGTQVSQSATPSATPTQGIIPSPTLIPSLFPTITLAPTVFPTTFIPSPTIAPIVTKGGLPPTGNPPTFLLIGGIFTAISGIALFLLTPH